MEVFKKALGLLSEDERRRLGFVFLMTLFMAIFEVAGIASVLPFLSMLANPEAIGTNRFLGWVYNVFGFTTERSFLIALGTTAFVLQLVAAGVRAYGQFVVTRFAQMRRHSISARLLEAYLRQPYEFFLNRHSGDLGKSILSEVDQAINSVLQPMANMIAQGFTLVLVAALLLLVNPYVAIGTVATLGAVYAAIFIVVRRAITRMGVRRVAANKERFELTGEALGGIKDLKLLGREKSYLTRFEEPSRTMAELVAANLVLAQVPKYAVEAVAFGGILLLSLILMLTSESGGSNLGTIVPLLGVYGFAIYRLLPAVQAVYQALTQFRFGSAAIDSLHADLKIREGKQELLTEAATPLPFNDRIVLEDLRYTYPGSDGVGVHGIDLQVTKGTTIGIVGTTGAGKTTLVDLLLGLLHPHSGRLAIDGTDVTLDNLRAWQANIGYVPQNVFLSDTSIAGNIAFGIPKEQIDVDRVKTCAEMARLANFVETELPEGYETAVGERGVRLSGGQIQRIGIARALYHDPELIVFDEATSALDNVTEREVMAAMNTLMGTKTVVMIAHRLSTVRKCDQIVVLNKGKVAGLGRWEDLIENNDTFKQLAANAEA